MVPKAKKPAESVRRSPRKTKPSAEKGEPDDATEKTVSPAKVGRKVTAKKATKGITVKKATSPAKGDVPATKSARSSPAKSPAPAKRPARTPTSKGTRGTKSPSPSKVAKGFARTPSPREVAGTKAAKSPATSTRKRATTDAAYVEHDDDLEDEPLPKIRSKKRAATDPAYVQHEDEDDAPALKTKGRPKKAAKIADEVGADEAPAKTRGRGRPKKGVAFEVATADQAGQIMESIEAPALPRPRSGSKSQSLARSTARSRSASPAKMSQRARAQSPAKNANASTRALSRSRSASPAKLNREQALHRQIAESALAYNPEDKDPGRSAPYPTVNDFDKSDLDSLSRARSASPAKPRASGSARGSLTERTSSPRKGSAASNGSTARGSISKGAVSPRKGSATPQHGSAEDQASPKKSSLTQLKSSVGLCIMSGGDHDSNVGRSSRAKSPAGSRRHSAGSAASSRRGSKSPVRSPSRARSVPQRSAAEMERALRLIATSEEQRTKDNVGADHLVQLPGGKRLRAASPTKAASKRPKKSARLPDEDEDGENTEAGDCDIFADEADEVDDLVDTDRDFDDSDWGWDEGSAADVPAGGIKTRGKRKNVQHPGREFERGDILQFNNQKYVRNTKGSGFLPKKNPFYERMPAPEVWHRRMPNVFPFGETPFMEREKSRQINEDLARSHEPESKPAESPTHAAEPDTLTKRVSSYIGNLFGSRDPTPSAPGPPATSATERRSRPRPPYTPYRSPYTLDPITDEELGLELAKLRRDRKQSDARQLADQLLAKRKSSDGSGSERASKRGRYAMSGGLGSR